MEEIQDHCYPPKEGPSYKDHSAVRYVSEKSEIQMTSARQLYQEKVGDAARQAQFSTEERLKKNKVHVLEFTILTFIQRNKMEGPKGSSSCEKSWQHLGGECVKFLEPIFFNSYWKYVVGIKEQCVKLG